MRTVIKFAGALLEDDATVRALARQVVALAREGHEILVVHGGAKLFTATLKRMSIESKFVGGLRVTDRETRDTAVMVFAGLLNKKLAAAISAEGQPAVGISAADSRCFLAEPMVHNEVEGSLGYVGYLTGLKGSCRLPPAWASARTTSCTTSMRITWPPPAPNSSTPIS
jgi:acetylglutamate kinase